MAKTINRLTLLTLYICNILLFSSIGLQAMEAPMKPFQVTINDGYIENILPYDDNNFLVYGKKHISYSKYYEAWMPFLAKWNIQEKKQVFFNHNLGWVNKAFKLKGPYIKLVYYSQCKFLILNFETGQIVSEVKFEKEAYQAYTKKSACMKGERIALFFRDNFVHIINKEGNIEKEFALNPCASSIIGTDGDQRIFQLIQEYEERLVLLIFHLNNDNCVERVVLKQGRKPYLSGMNMHVIDSTHIAISTGTGYLSIFNLETKKIELHFQAHDGPISSIITINDELIAICGFLDGIVRIWSRKDKKLINQFKGPKYGSADPDLPVILSIIGHSHIAYGNRNKVFVSPYC